MTCIQRQLNLQHPRDFALPPTCPRNTRRRHNIMHRPNQASSIDGPCTRSLTPLHPFTFLRLVHTCMSHNSSCDGQLCTVSVALCQSPSVVMRFSLDFCWCGCWHIAGTCGVVASRTHHGTAIALPIHAYCTRASCTMNRTHLNSPRNSAL